MVCGVDFFVTAATIIPVLFLALIYQVELFRNPKKKPGDRLVAVVGVAVLGVLSALTEGQSLHVLAIGHASKSQRSNVATGVWALVIFTFLTPALLQLVEVLRRPDDDEDDDDEDDEKQRFRPVPTAVVAFFLACFVVAFLLNPI